MDTNIQILKIIENHEIILISDGDIIEQKIKQFPYVQFLKVIYLKYLYKFDKQKFNEESPKILSLINNKIFVYEQLDSFKNEILQEPKMIENFNDQYLDNQEITDFEKNLNFLGLSYLKDDLLKNHEIITENQINDFIEEKIQEIHEENLVENPINDFIEEKIQEIHEENLVENPINDFVEEKIQEIHEENLVENPINDFVEEKIQEIHEENLVENPINDFIEEKIQEIHEENLVENSNFEGISFDLDTTIEGFEIPKQKIETQKNIDFVEPIKIITENQKLNFTDWASLNSNSFIPTKIESEIIEEKNPKIDKAIIIDNFIEKNPKISPIKSIIKDENIQNKDLIIQKDEISEKEEELLNFFEHSVTETLALLYTEQGKYERAIRAYEILSLKNTKKSSYFAKLIQEVINLKNSK